MAASTLAGLFAPEHFGWHLAAAVGAVLILLAGFGLHALRQERHSNRPPLFDDMTLQFPAGDEHEIPGKSAADPESG